MYMEFNVRVCYFYRCVDAAASISPATCHDQLAPRTPHAVVSALQRHRVDSNKRNSRVPAGLVRK